MQLSRVVETFAAFLKLLAKVGAKICCWENPMVNFGALAKVPSFLQ